MDEQEEVKGKRSPSLEVHGYSRWMFLGLEMPPFVSSKEEIHSLPVLPVHLRESNTGSGGFPYPGLTPVGFQP